MERLGLGCLGPGNLGMLTPVLVAELGAANWPWLVLGTLALVVAATGVGCIFAYLGLRQALKEALSNLAEKALPELVGLHRQVQGLSEEVRGLSNEVRTEFRDQVNRNLIDLRKEVKDYRGKLKQREQSRVDLESRFWQLQKDSRIRELPLAAVFAGIEEIAIPLGAINTDTGHVNQAELLYVCAVAAYQKCRNIFEFGTFLGRTTYHLAIACPEAKVFTLDLPEEKNPWAGAHLGAYFKGTERERQIVQLRCDSGSLDTTPYRDRMDLIWVDGDHSLQMVKNDTHKALEMLAPGGLILWHDYAAKTIDVVEYFQQFTRKTPLFRLKNTSILLYIDGVDPLTFVPHRPRVSQALLSDEKIAKVA